MMKTESMNTIVELFYLVVIADGTVDPKELALGKRMARLEGFDANRFEDEMVQLIENPKDVYVNCILGLKKLSKESQINFLAWMCLIANADGFMHNAEWDLIYKIYHKELKLDRQAILDHQFKLNQKLRKF
ncbi:MAG: TerB family tellurite resistance protein [Bacteroidota bacterium]